VFVQKEESARLLVEVATRKKRQSETLESLRRENAALRDELNLTRHEIADLQYQSRQQEQQLHRYQRMVQQHQQQQLVMGEKNSRRGSSGPAGVNRGDIYAQSERMFASMPPSSEMTSSLLAPIAEVEDYMRAISNGEHVPAVDARSQSRQRRPEDRYSEVGVAHVDAGVRVAKKASRTNSMPSDAQNPYAMSKSASTSSVNGIGNKQQRGSQNLGSKVRLF
jgi:hypothetical protein